MKKINFIVFIILSCFSTIGAQQLDKLYLSLQNVGSAYDITSLNNTLGTAVFTQTANPERIANLAIGYDPNNTFQLTFLHGGTVDTEAIYKTVTGTTTSLTNLNAQGIGGYGTNNAPGAFFGRSYGYVPGSKTVWEVYPTYQSIGAITGDTNWNYPVTPPAATPQTDTSVYSTIFASDAAFDVYNNIYTIVERQTNGINSTATYSRFLYRVNLTSRVATQVVQISGPVGTAVPGTIRKPLTTQIERDAYLNVGTSTSVGNVRGISYLNGLFYVATGNGLTQTVIYSINPKTGVSALVATYTAGTASSNIDLAGDQYYAPFYFNCGASGGGLQGAPYFTKGTASSNTLRVNIKNVFYTETPVNLTISGTDITTQTTTVSLAPNQTFVDLPISYTGGGNTGYRTVTVTLQGSEQKCVYDIAVDEDTDLDGIPNSNDLDDDNDGILDTAEGCAGTVTMATLSPALATSLGTNDTAIFPLVPPGAVIPQGGVRITKTSGGNGWGTFTPNNATASVTIGGASSAPFSTTYLDIVGGGNIPGIPRSLDINFGVSAGSLSSGNNEYQYIIGIAGLGNEGASVSTTFSVPLTVIQNVDVFATNRFSLFGGVTPTPGQTGTVFSTSSPNTGPNAAQGYTFFLVPKSVASFVMDITGGNDPHGFIFGVYRKNCTVDTDGDGILDYLDTDSDNDGCPDAIEGSENVLTSQLSAGRINTASNGGIGANTVTNLGVPTIVNPGGTADNGNNTVGQAVGSAQNANINSCFVYAQNDTNGITLGQTSTGNVLYNDNALDGTALTVASATYINSAGISTPMTLGVSTAVYSGTTLAGQMTLNTNGNYTFIAAAGFTGAVPINYTASNTSGNSAVAVLTIKVIAPGSGGNNAPVAQNDTSATIAGSPVTSNALSNDKDFDGNTITISSATINSSAIAFGTNVQVSGVNANGATVANAGTININQTTGAYTFTPAAGFVGTVDQVNYVISDGNGGISSANIVIKVTPNGNTSVTYANDDYNISKGTVMTGNVLDNDTDPQSATQTRTVTAANFNGTVLTIGNTTAITGVGSLTLTANGTYTFSPAAGFVGTVNVPYTVCDNGTPQACDNATLHLTSLRSYCYKTPSALGGTALPVRTGITSLNRAGSTSAEWPLIRRGAWIVLESKTKGFVVNRLSITQINAITAPVEGMVVYDTSNNCMKMYTSNDGGTTFGWFCITTQSCPD